MKYLLRERHPFKETMKKYFVNGRRTDKQFLARGRFPAKKTESAEEALTWDSERKLTREFESKTDGQTICQIKHQPKLVSTGSQLQVYFASFFTG